MEQDQVTDLGPHVINLVAELAMASSKKWKFNYEAREKRNLTSFPPRFPICCFFSIKKSRAEIKKQNNVF